MKTPKRASRNSSGARRTLRRAVCEVLEQRRLLSGLPDGSANVADLTAITSQGAVVTIDPMLQGPLQAPFDGMQVKAEVWQPDGKHILVGQWNGNWAMARYNAAWRARSDLRRGWKDDNRFRQSLRSGAERLPAR